MMTKMRTLLALIILTVCAGNATALDNLYVVQVGDGAAALNTSAAALTIKEFNAANGSPTGSISLPTAVSGANQPITVRGSATSEGFLALSTDGNYLTLGGYGAAPGTPTVAESDSSVVSRVIGRVTVSSSAVDTSTALTDAYTGIASNAASFRSVVST